MRFLGVAFKSGLAVFDQGITSGSSLLLNVLLARFLTREAYGAFAVAFAVLLVLSGFHNVLLLEPLSVIGPARYADQLLKYFDAQTKIHGLIVVIPSILLLAASGCLAIASPGNPLVSALAGAGMALPLLLLYWLARRMMYVLRRPGLAFAGSGVYLFLIAGGTFVLWKSGLLTVLTAFALLAFSGLGAAVFLFFLSGLHTSRQHAKPICWQAVLKENWGYGHWLVASTILFSVSTQIQTFLVASLLSLSAAGMLRAMQIPMMAMVQVITAISLLEMPRLATLASQGQFAHLRKLGIRITAVLTCTALSYEFALLFWAGTIDRLAFGAKYASYDWLIPLLGLAPVFMAFGAGLSVTLRALQKPKFDFVMNCFAAPVGIISGLAFIIHWGVAGAGISLVLSFAISALVTLYFFHKEVPATDLPDPAILLASEVLN